MLIAASSTKSDLDEGESCQGRWEEERYKKHPVDQIKG